MAALPEEACRVVDEDGRRLGDTMGCQSPKAGKDRVLSAAVGMVRHDDSRKIIPTADLGREPVHLPNVVAAIFVISYDYEQTRHRGSGIPAPNSTKRNAAELPAGAADELNLLDEFLERVVFSVPGEVRVAFLASQFQRDGSGRDVWAEDE